MSCIGDWHSFNVGIPVKFVGVKRRPRVSVTIGEAETRRVNFVSR